MRLGEGSSLVQGPSVTKVTLALSQHLAGWLAAGLLLAGVGCTSEYWAPIINGLLGFNDRFLGDMLLHRGYVLLHRGGIMPHWGDIMLHRHHMWRICCICCVWLEYDAARG